MSSLERLSLIRWAPPWVRYEHKSRYEWACQFSQGLRVLDAASGTGYGTAILERGGASQVLGLDVSQDAIEEARALYGNRRGMHFQVADILRLPVRSASCDVYVCSETIEHVVDD